jgi:putative ABC transport system ATP-binding protein
MMVAGSPDGSVQQPRSAAVIEARGVRKAYRLGDNVVWALKGIDITIEHGEFVAVMGPSGSGKSTFMHLAGCLDRPTEGALLLNGENVTTLDAEALAKVRNKYIGFVFQQFNLLPRTSALENVCLPLLYSSVPEREWHARARRCLELVGLADRLDHGPTQLSGGQQQRVAIARALVNEPLLLLADEPTGALDSQTGEEIMHIFCELNDAGKTIVLVTHEPEIAAFAKRRLTFRDGLLVSDQRNEARARA